MPKKTFPDLSRRERQIMDVVYQRGQASVADVVENLSDPPSYSAVRALMNILVDKAVLKVDRDSPRYVYRPTRSPRHVGRSRIKQIVRTFFDGSVERAVAALIETHDTQLTPAELERLQALVEQAREKGKKP